MPQMYGSTIMYDSTIDIARRASRWLEYYDKLRLSKRTKEIDIKCSNGNTIIIVNGVLLTEPVYVFPSDEMIAQLLLLLD